MGMLVEGQWADKWYKPDSKGRFVRPETHFRNQIETGPDATFAPESGRYHLYVAYACPWAHRTLIMRHLKGLEAHIDISVVSPDMGDQGWTFDRDHGSTGDPLHSSRFLHEIYTRAAPDYTGRVTVPVLWDKRQGTIVNNESREVMRLLDHAFADLAAPDAPDLAPGPLLDQIDAMIDANYEPVNNGVYKCGFATTQEAYDEAVDALFARLDTLDTLLQRQQWLLGESPTEADICLYTTLVRFDPVYAIHFKCSRRRIVDYPGLRRYLHDLWQIPAFHETTHMDHIRRHYYWSHESINPHRIIADEPVVQAIGTP